MLGEKQVSDIGPMLRAARGGKLTTNFGGNLLREMCVERWDRLEIAQQAIDKALAENRALSADERGRIDQLFAEADELTPAIEMVRQNRQRELEAAASERRSHA